MPDRVRHHDDAGQAAAELVAVVPLLVLVVIALAQLALAGHAAWSAANAARAGARAAHVGGDARSVALDSLPDHLRDGAEVEDSGPIRVRVEAPGLLPGLPRIPLSASAELDPDPGGDG
jgi:TadE-like protein